MGDKKLEEAFQAGSWLGRKQAFSGMAGRCSAADAQCLRSMRDEKAHQAMGLTWEQFCTRRMGLSRSMADRAIRLLEEFGEAYFHLHGLTAIAPQDYRLIAGAVSAEGVQTGLEVIPLAPQNAVRLSAAVANLKRQARLARSAPPAPPPSKAAFRKAARRLEAAVEGLEQLLSAGGVHPDRRKLSTVVAHCSRRLAELDGSLRP